MRTLATIVLIYLSIQNTYSQKVPTLGTPYIQNYSKSLYNAGNQNWSIAQNNDGEIFIGNSIGLLTYDGSYWNLYPLNNQKDVRSVAIDTKGDVYVGGKEEFGIFRRIKGKLIYEKISTLVKDEEIENEEIWKIHFIGDAALFQSFSKIYIYKNGKIDIQHGDGQPFLFSHKVNNNIWIEKIPAGLLKWKNNKFEEINQKLSDVLCILPFQNENFLVGTAKNGLYILTKDGDVKPWLEGSLIHKLLCDAQINNGLKITNNSYAFGTIKNGIFIIDDKGNLLQHVHRRNGLQNNTILSLMLDQQGNIWAGLDNGIDRVEINSPFYFYKDTYGEVGTIYSVKIFKSHIYIGTNQGLYYSTWSNNNKRELQLHFMPGTQGQVWSLDIFNNQLICGHNNGTFLIEGNRIEKISGLTGGWVNKVKDNIFIQGNYTGLALFEDKPTWEFKYKFPNLTTAILDVFQKDANHYWIVFNNSIHLMEVSIKDGTLTKIKDYTFKKNFPNIQRLRVNLVEGIILFSTDKGIFIYDNVLQKFSLYTELNSQLGSYSKANKISSLGAGEYMLTGNGRFAKVYFSKGKFNIDSVSFNILNNQVVKNHENIELHDNKFFFGLDNGLAVYDPSYKINQTLTSPIVNGYKHLNSPVDTLLTFNSNNKIPYTKNSIRILFSSRYYTSSPLKYQYILGNDKESEWSAPNQSPYIDLNNLKYGNHTFKVRSLQDNGVASEATIIQFQIATPWYFSWKALIAYLIISIVSFIVAKKAVDKKIAYDKGKLKAEFKRQQENLLKEETVQNEKKLMELKHEQLIQELEQKNRELANAATNILYKNELLNNLNEELNLVKDKSGNTLSQDQLKKVNKLIINARTNERDWDLFEKSFNESHVNFFKKLKHDYPTLSPNDLKLCAYLRLNMSSKDIASLINISIRGVEIRRYRLRKKFNLQTDKNLNEFLIEL